MLCVAPIRSCDEIYSKILLITLKDECGSGFWRAIKFIKAEPLDASADCSSSSLLSVVVLTRVKPGVAYHAAPRSSLDAMLSK